MRITIAIVLLLALCIPTMAQTTNLMGIPDMVGNWTGVLDTVTWQKNTAWMPNETVSYWPKSEEMLVITEQKGNMFSGKIVPKLSPGSTEIVLGIIGPDNTTIDIVDEDSFYWGKMISPTKMELFYQEVDIEGMTVSAGTFEKM
ncbi:MAG TPA: hypothetical protein VLY86_01095 [Methanothrix sp.]|nr:hypothetical protein [Methanothrix sp.]